MDFLARIADLFADKSPKAVAIIKYFTAVLDGKVTIPGGIAMLMAELNCDGYVDPEIGDTLLPGADAFVSIEEVRPVEIDMDVWTDPEAIAYLAGLNPPMQPVMPDKGIKWAVANKETQRASPLVISGQKCRSSGGRVCVLVLRGHDGQRCASLYGVQSRFHRYHRVLAEPKEVAPGT